MAAVTACPWRIDPQTFRIPDVLTGPVAHDDLGPYTRDPGCGWAPWSAATGDGVLVVLYPRPFGVVAGRLLHPAGLPVTP